MNILKLTMKAQHYFSSSFFVLTMALSCNLAYAETDCVPEGVENENPAMDIPALFPAAIPLPSERFVMSASSGEADEYNPYPFATIEFITPGTRDQLFDYYEKALPAAGYRIVMWEKDTGATGFRIRSDDIDQATIAVNEYDCRAFISINVSLLP